MFFVSGIRANRDPDAGAEFLDQLPQEFRVAVVKPLNIDWISDRSMPSPTGRMWASTPPRFSPRIRCGRDAPAVKIGQKATVYRTDWKS